MQPWDASVAAWPGSSGSWKDRLLSGRFGMVFANGVPPLGFNRQAAGGLARGLLSDLGANAEQVQVLFVRASDLLDSDEPVTFHDVGACVTDDRQPEPLNKEDCLRGVPAVSIAPRERIQVRVASLSIGRRLSEDLIALGNEAVRRKVRGDSKTGDLREAILRCLQSTSVPGASQ
jgi:hypothetical protein